MEFEYDSEKSESNKSKHGIDFEDAKALWSDPDAYEIPARAGKEERLILVGEIEGIGWTAVFTYRGKKIRIVSVRRSRFKEAEYYDHRKRIR